MTHWRMMTGVSRYPGETIEQWFLRATMDYQAAWAALRVESNRLLAERGRRFPPYPYPLLDEGYDGAMDALEAADDDRTDAAIALDRERQPG